MRKYWGVLILLMNGALFGQQGIHWEDNVIFGAGFMGPNALPVPWMNTGNTDNQSWIQASGVSHLSEGEQTYSLNTRANICIVPDLIAFDLYWVPVETFRMSPEIIEQRVVLPSAIDQTTAIGDVYLSSILQLIDKKKIHAALRAGFKFPSSDGVALSRFTDSPGYHLDAGIGITLRQTDHAMTDFSAMAGFYSYQTQGGFANYRQNDAFLFGMALNHQHHTWSLRNEIRGYVGYFDLRDKPIVIRSEYRRNLGPIELMAACQVGIHDLYYIAPEIGLRVHIHGTVLGQRLRE